MKIVNGERWRRGRELIPSCPRLISHILWNGAFLETLSVAVRCTLLYFGGLASWKNTAKIDVGVNLNLI